MPSSIVPDRWIATTPAMPWKAQRPAASVRGPVTLRLTGDTLQTWEGFGGCFNELGHKALSVLPAATRERIVAELFDPRKDCRFTLGRLPIGASDYALDWYSCNETPGDFAMKRFTIERDRRALIPYIRSALKHQPDLQLFASPWSPPTWLKSPPVYNWGRLIWKKPYLEAYALYFVRFVKAYAGEGIRIAQIHPQNEPVADQKFPSCIWTGAQLRDFIRDHLGPAFRKHGLDCEIWLGTLNSDDFDEFPLTVLGDARAGRYVSGVGFQWAGRGAIQRTHRAWPDLRIYQTENECGDGRNTWEYARYIFRLLQHYITNGANGYLYWNMVLPKGGVSTWGWLQNAMISVDMESRRVTYNPEFHVMRHFSRFIQPGSVNLGLSGPWSGNAVAFRRPDGRRVLVIANPFPDARGLTFDAGTGVLSVRLAGHSWNTLVLAGAA